MRTDPDKHEKIDFGNVLYPMIFIVEGLFNALNNWKKKKRVLLLKFINRLSMLSILKWELLHTITHTICH